MSLFDSKRSHKILATGVRLLAGYLGLFLVMIGFIMLLPLFMIVVFPGEWRAWASFVVPGGGAILIGSLLYFFCLFRTDKGKLGKHQDIILLVLLWVMALVVGAFPFFLNQYFVPGATSYTYLEGLFESTSGFTTTGLTIFQDYLDMAPAQADTNAWLETNSPHIFIFYRSVCHFFGGVGLVLVASSAISDSQGMKLYSAEGHTDKLLPNLKKSARLILTIYAGYIVLGTLGLWLFGMDWFDALQHSVAALATGGLSSRSTSLYYFLNPENIANYQTVYGNLSSGCAFSSLSGFNGITPINTIGMEVVTLISMLLGATCFMLHVELFTLKWKQFFRDVEIHLVIHLPRFGVSVHLLPYHDRLHQRAGYAGPWARGFVPLRRGDERRRRHGFDGGWFEAIPRGGLLQRAAMEIQIPEHQLALRAPEADLSLWGSAPAKRWRKQGCASL